VRAFNVNEVRYNPKFATDEQAAQLLAADIRATGKQVAAAANGLVKSGVLEVWVSR
jgi:hypothetical protein